MSDVGAPRYERQEPVSDLSPDKKPNHGEEQSYGHYLSAPGSGDYADILNPTMETFEDPKMSIDMDNSIEINNSMQSGGSSYSADDSIIRRVEQEIAAARLAAANARRRLKTSDTSVQLDVPQDPSDPDPVQLMDSLTNSSTDEDMRNILNTCTDDEEKKTADPEIELSVERRRLNPIPAKVGIRDMSYENALHLLSGEFGNAAEMGKNQELDDPIVDDATDHIAIELVYETTGTSDQEEVTPTAASQEPSPDVSFESDTAPTSAWKAKAKEAISLAASALDDPTTQSLPLADADPSNVSAATSNLESEDVEDGRTEEDISAQEIVTTSVTETEDALVSTSSKTVVAQSSTEQDVEISGSDSAEVAAMLSAVESESNLGSDTWQAVLGQSASNGEVEASFSNTVQIGAMTSADENETLLASSTWEAVVAQSASDQEVEACVSDSAEIAAMTRELEKDAVLAGFAKRVVEQSVSKQQDEVLDSLQDLDDVVSGCNQPIESVEMPLVSEQENAAVETAQALEDVVAGGNQPIESLEMPLAAEQTTEVVESARDSVTNQPIKSAEMPFVEAKKSDIVESAQDLEDAFTDIKHHTEEVEIPLVDNRGDVSAADNETNSEIIDIHQLVSTLAFGSPDGGSWKQTKEPSESLCGSSEATEVMKASDPKPFVTEGSEPAPAENLTADLIVPTDASDNVLAEEVSQQIAVERIGELPSGEEVGGEKLTATIDHDISRASAEINILKSHQADSPRNGSTLASLEFGEDPEKHDAATKPVSSHQDATHETSFEGIRAETEPSRAAQLKDERDSSIPAHGKESGDTEVKTTIQPSAMPPVRPEPISGPAVANYESSSVSRAVPASTSQTDTKPSPARISVGASSPRGLENTRPPQQLSPMKRPSVSRPNNGIFVNERNVEPEGFFSKTATRIRFRDPFPVITPPQPHRDRDVITSDHAVGLPEIQVRWVKPKTELKHLIVAAMGTSLQRRSNACGALKVLTAEKRNQMTLVRTDSFLGALLFAASQDIPRKEPDLAIDARTRAVGCLRNVCLPKDNRLIVFKYPGLVECLVKVIREDTTEGRALGCATIALLSKTPGCRETIAATEGLVSLLSNVLRGTVEVSEPTPAPVKTMEPSEREEDQQENNDDADSMSEVSHSSRSSADEDDHNSDGESYSSTSSAGSSPVREAAREQSVAPKAGLLRVDSIRNRQEEKKDEFIFMGRSNSCAALLHLSKHCSVTHILCSNPDLLSSAAWVAQEIENPFHTKCLEILCNLSCFPDNNAILTTHPGLVDVLVNASSSKVAEDRVLSLRALQNMSSDASSREALATEQVLNLVTACAMRKEEHEREAAVATLYNISTEPSAVVAITNAKNVVATLVHLAHTPDSPPNVRQMACEALATISLWLQSLAGTGKTPAGVANLLLPSHKTAGWERWD